MISAINTNQYKDSGDNKSGFGIIDLHCMQSWIIQTTYVGWEKFIGYSFNLSHTGQLNMQQQLFFTARMDRFCIFNRQFIDAFR